MKLSILQLCEFSGHNHDNASFEVRLLTAQKLAAKGHRVTFIYPSSKRTVLLKKIVQKNVTVLTSPGLLPLRFRSGGFSILDCIIKTIYILFHKVDVIHVTNGHRPSHFFPCLIGKLKGCAIVDEAWEWFGKGGYASQRKGAIGSVISLYDILTEKQFKKIYDSVIVISNSLKAHFGNSKKVHVLYGGADTNGLKDYPMDESRDMLNINKKSFVIGMSNLIKSDHADNKIFFSAFKKLCRKKDDLYLVATGHEKSYIQQIEEEFHCKGRIIFPGYVSFQSYNRYLASCNLFVLPYPDTTINRGRWPNKFGDYLCLNRPILSNPTGDLKKILEEFKIGFLCKEESEQYYQLILKLLSDNIDLNMYNVDSLYVARNLLSFDNRIEKIEKIFYNITS